MTEKLEFFLKDGDSETSFRLTNSDAALRSGHDVTVMWVIPEGHKSGPYIKLINHSLKKQYNLEKNRREILDILAGTGRPPLDWKVVIAGLAFVSSIVMLWNASDRYDNFFSRLDEIYLVRGSAIVSGLWFLSSLTRRQPGCGIFLTAVFLVASFVIGENARHFYERNDGSPFAYYLARVVFYIVVPMVPFAVVRYRSNKNLIKAAQARVADRFKAAIEAVWKQTVAEK